MAVYVRHVLSTDGPKILKNSLKSPLILPVRFTQDHKKVRKLPKRFIPNVQIQPKLNSLSSQGFLRNVTSYQPPENTSEKLSKVFREIVKTDDPEYVVNNEQKFQLLSALSGEFAYTVPNSLLHRMVTLGNIQEYYSTPVENIVPYDNLKNADLPPNLHIMHDYHRFHPDTDTMFNGVSAFPKSSTFISGLKTKEKYKGHEAGSPWHDI